MADRLDYSGYDFDTALAQLESKLELQDGWKDRVKSATGQIFLRLLAYVIDMDGFKIDRRAEEGYRDFARIRSSIVAIAANLGYTPRRKVSSVCTLRFTATDTPPISVPKWTPVQTAGGVQFVTTEAGTITGAYVDVPAMQGIRKNNNSNVSDGSPNQQYQIPNTGDDVEAVENSIVEAAPYTGFPSWTRVDSFIGQAPDAEVFVLVRKKDFLLVIFGDGKNGKIPDFGAEIDLRWVETLGSAGDVPGVGAIDTINSSLSSQATVSNIDAAQGGEDEEGIEEIRVNMSNIFATGDRAVTGPDYRAILLAYPGVAKANAYGEQEVLTGGSNPDYAWRVELVVVPTGGGLLTRTQENQILAFLETKKVNTTWITFKDPTYIPLDFAVHAVLSEDADPVATKTAIEAALDNVVNFIDVDLGDAFRFNDSVAAVEAVDGVRYSAIETLATFDGGLGDGTTGPFAGTLPVVPVDRGNVLVYLEEVSTGIQRRVGYDDGSGTFTSDPLVADPRVTGTSVDYETGAYILNFSTNVTSAYRIVLKYQTGIQKTKVFGVGDGAVLTFTGVLERSLSPNFVEIYEEGILVGTDDGAGNIVDSGGSRISTGSVNYVTGDIQVTFDTTPPADESEISSKFHYEFPDIEVGIDQMILMGNKDVTTEVQA